jgi:hypothetical protein
VEEVGIVGGGEGEGDTEREGRRRKKKSRGRENSEQERVKQVKISTEWKKEMRKNFNYIFIVQISSLLWRGVGFL